jgi:hypothetical protein
MNKKCFLLVFVFSINIFVYGQEIDVDYLIRAIPFTEFRFSDGREWVRDTHITILGWSRDGKILFREEWDATDHDYIIDLVTDEIIWQERDRDNKNFHSSSRNIYIAQVAKEFGIEPVVGNIGTFPYVRNNEIEYNILTTIQNNYINVSLYKGTNKNKTKYINRIEIDRTLWSNRNYHNKLTFQYIKSPFENRLAILFIIPRLNEFGTDWNYFKIYGTHLDIGL